MKNILSEEKLNIFMESVIEMNKDEFILHEWEKEQLDAMVRENELEMAKEEKTMDIIKSMIKKKLSYEDISEITGKTIEKIKEIENSMEVE